MDTQKFKIAILKVLIYLIHYSTLVKIYTIKPAKKVINIENIKQALILAGGEGTRLKPITEKVPKPMVEVHNQPFLKYIFEPLRYHLKLYRLLSSFLLKVNKEKDK